MPPSPTHLGLVYILSFIINHSLSSSSSSFHILYHYNPLSPHILNLTTILEKWDFRAVNWIIITPLDSFLYLLDRIPVLNVGCLSEIFMLRIFRYARNERFLRNQTNLMKRHSEILWPIKESKIPKTGYYVPHLLRKEMKTS